MGDGVWVWGVCVFCVCQCVGGKGGCLSLGGGGGLKILLFRKAFQVNVLLIEGGVVMFIKGGVVMFMEGGVVMFIKGGVVMFMEGGVVMFMEGGVH